VTRVLEGRNRRLLFRSYIFLAGGLLVVGIVLDIGFGSLQSRGEPEIDPWLVSTVDLIEQRLAAAPPGDRPAIAGAIAAEIGVGITLLSADDVHVSDTSGHGLAPLIDADGRISYLHDAGSISAVIRLGPIDEPQQSLLLRLLPPLFYVSIFVLVGLWIRPLLKDLNVISSASQRFAADYREPIATANQTTELKPLARNLDEMSGRLSGVLKSQKELIAALSHEMRTPLARLRFALAVAGDRADPELREKLDAMNTDVHEIDALIASMLSYARLDHPDIRMHWQNVPATPWLDKIAEKSASDRIDIETVNQGTSETLCMDPKLMELALSNLLVNAMKYARQSVRCTLDQTDEAYTLAVEDDGPGIPEDSRDAVFRAFTRLDDSRSRDTGGSGLGLAIVARVAALHGGRAAVDASPTLGGARFSIHWPKRED